MKNYEKYADEIKRVESVRYCEEFVRPIVLAPLNKICTSMNCDHCKMLQTLWLFEEYEEPKEPEVDWSKVPVDTPILVKYDEDEEWQRRHFAKYENGKVYAWDNGGTSWSEEQTALWKYAKLAETEGAE